MTSLRHLHYFVAVAEEGQLTRAAHKLHISQPALSQAIAQLESQVGVALLERHARGVGLTAAGETIFEKARRAVEALADVDLTAHSLSRAAHHSVDCGFVSVPPNVAAPALFEQYAVAYPEVEVCFRGLSLPRDSTAAALEEVDVAVYHSPSPDEQVEALVLRHEPRVAVMGRDHPLAQHSALTVADVLDETFCGTDPACDSVRCGFWRLDDHRGGPGATTDDRAATPHEVIAVVASGRGLWTAATGAAAFLNGLPSIVTVPLRDARPATLELVWHKGNRNPQVAALCRMARVTHDSVMQEA